MGVLYFLADAFINTFGITRPTETGRRRAAYLILGMMLIMLAGIVVAGVVIHSVMK